MKRGRPRKANIAANRVVSVILDEPAFKIYRAIKTVRKVKGWLNQYVSEKLKVDFSQDFQKAIRVQELLELQYKRDTIENEIRVKAHQIAKDKIDQEVKKTASMPILVEN